MTLTELTDQLKKDTNNSLSAARWAAYVDAGLMTYSEALAQCNGNLFYKGEHRV